MLELEGCRNAAKCGKRDVFVVVAYGHSFLDSGYSSWACVNVHGSILPKYRGAAPIQRWSFDREKTTGNYYADGCWDGYQGRCC